MDFVGDPSVIRYLTGCNLAILGLNVVVFGTSSSQLSRICSPCCSCAGSGCRVISLFLKSLTDYLRLSLGSIGAKDSSLAMSE